MKKHWSKEKDGLELIIELEPTSPMLNNITPNYLVEFMETWFLNKHLFNEIFTDNIY